MSVDAPQRDRYRARGVSHFVKTREDCATANGASGGILRFCAHNGYTVPAVGAGFSVALALLLFAIPGCSVGESTFEIADYREPGVAKRYRESFDEAYYTLDDDGNLDLILRRSEPSESDPKHIITQVIHIRSVWRCIPGETVTHRTQINGTVSYHIISGRVGATFEGAGSVFFKHRKRTDTLTGTLDLASLRPKRRLAGGADLFRRAELRGRFRATRDPRRVVRIINEMNRLFGPLPPP